MCSTCPTAARASKSSLWKTRNERRTLQLHPLDELLEPRMPAQGVEHRVHLEIREPPAPLVVRDLCPVERLVEISESEVDHRERNRRDVVSGTNFLEAAQDFARSVGVPGERKGISERRV